MSIECEHEGCVNSFECKHRRTIGDIPGCVQPTHVPGLCEQTGCSEESTVEQYCAAIDAYVNDLHGFTENMLWTILAARHPIHPGCCPGHSGLILDLELAGLL